MSDYRPKVGDKVMVGEHGPYRVGCILTRKAEMLDERGDHVSYAHLSWLTPAPEPEPDEPTAFGALVRDGDGRLWVHSPIEGSPDSPAWDAADRLSSRWPDIPRPVTVVLADPAEVEQLRAEVEGLREDVKHAEALADELQRRIDKVLHEVDRDGYATKAYLHLGLRGES